MLRVNASTRHPRRIWRYDLAIFPRPSREQAVGAHRVIVDDNAAPQHLPGTAHQRRLEWQ